MTTVYRFGNAQLLADQRRLVVDGQDSRIGARAFDLLLALVERRDRTVTKNELLEAVWPGVVVEESNLQVHISSLRKVLGPTFIATIPGRGYRFTGVFDAAAEDEVNAVVQGLTAAQSDATSAHLSNLPAELPPLYGRADDLPALRSLIESHRLVTLVGAGGIGKTALALALAHELRASVVDGVWLVELAPLTDASLVAGTVAGVLRITLGADASIETLAKALGTNRMLLVLDNCEHLLQRVAELAAAFLRAAPNLRLLATSQEPLKIAQEQVYRLGPLTLPGGGGMAEARKAGAVALFEARARAADTRFALAEPNVAAVTEICRRLDGIALAIELAAARVPLLGVDGLRLRLDERFRILTGGARLALPRHQTLRAALDWSHGLLTQAEQILFRRLGAFLGSFGLESAQRVAAGTDLDEWAVLDQLGGLVDKSLVVADSGAAPRYRLLETSRAFALEKLREAQESEAIMRRHAEALLAVFEESLEAEYVLSTQARLERYLPDLDNARAALDWSAGTSGDPQLHIALAGAIGWIWFDAELRPEGLRRTQAAIATIGPSTPPHLEARLLASWPLLAHPIVGARELAALARAIEIYRQLGDRRPLFAALSRQVKYLLYRDRREEAELSLQEAERLFDADWPPAIRSELLFALGTLRDTQGRFEEGIAAHEEILHRATTLNNNGLALKALINLEQGEAALGRLESSVARGRAMIRLMREDRSLRSGNEHFVLKNLHMSLVRLGAIDEALEVMRALHPVLERVGRTYELMEPCALLALKRGRPDDGARLLGYADLDFSTNDIGRDPVEQLLRESLVQGLRDALPAAELSRLLEEGEGLSDEDALRLALRE